MKKIFSVCVLAAGLALGGCATFDQNIQNAWSVLTQQSIPSSYLIVAANSFDALEGTGTQYLKYCKANPTQLPACSLSNMNAVYRAIRQARPVRAQIESYISTGSNAPPALYQQLLGIISSIKGLIPAQGA